MLWGQRIITTVEGNNILFQGYAEDAIKCNGTSGTVIGGHEFSNSFLLVMREEDRNEVIAVSLESNHLRLTRTFLIGVIWKDGSPYIDPKKKLGVFCERPSGCC